MARGRITEQQEVEREAIEGILATLGTARYLSKTVKERVDVAKKYGLGDFLQAASDDLRAIDQLITQAQKQIKDIR